VLEGVPLVTDGPAPHRVTVHGHARAVAALTRAVAAGRGAQVYLLAGPPAVGKRTVARYLAQVLLCPHADAGGGPCGACRACRMVQAGTFSDLHLVAPPLRIEAVRELQHLLALAPGEASRRVAIVADIETASPGAANCLLKTLEEPPSQAVLVLTTGAPALVPATVRSRCRIVAFRPLPDRAVARALVETWHVDEARANLLAGLSAGQLGWAVRALADDTALPARRSWLDLLATVLAADRAGRLARAGEIAAGGAPVAECLSTWRTWWRDVLLTGHDLEAAVVNRDRADEIRAAADRYDARAALGALRALDDTLGRLAANVNARLAVEVLLLGLP
jgi:DNA polymerase-3 subunit delta'